MSSFNAQIIYLYEVSLYRVYWSITSAEYISLRRAQSSMEEIDHPLNQLSTSPSHPLSLILSSFNHLSRPLSQVAAPRRASVVTKADFIGSNANLAMVVSTTLFLAAGRFGLAPTAGRPVSAGLKFGKRETGIITNDPSGFTWADVLALGKNFFPFREFRL